MDRSSKYMYAIKFCVEAIQNGIEVFVIFLYSILRYIVDVCNWLILFGLLIVSDIMSNLRKYENSHNFKKRKHKTLKTDTRIKFMWKLNQLWDGYGSANKFPKIKALQLISIVCSSSFAFYGSIKREMRNTKKPTTVYHIYINDERGRIVFSVAFFFRLFMQP